MPGLRMPCGLGTAHQQQAYNMTCRAALAVAVCLTVLAAAGVVASPLLALLAPVYFVAELLFAMIWYYRYLMLSYQPVKHRPLSHDPVSSFKKAMAHLKLFADIRHFLSIWWVCMTSATGAQQQLWQQQCVVSMKPCGCSILQGLPSAERPVWLSACAVRPLHHKQACDSRLDYMRIDLTMSTHMNLSLYSLTYMHACIPARRFHGAPLEDIKRDNVADLLAYAFFYKTR